MKISYLNKQNDTKIEDFRPIMSKPLLFDT
jgi:hypothetical protein